MNAALIEKQRELEQKRNELKALFDAHKDEKGNYTHSADQLAELNARNDELTALGKAFDDAHRLYLADQKNAEELARLTALGAAPVHPTGGTDQTTGEAERKAIANVGQQYIEAIPKGLTPIDLKYRTINLPDVDLKTLMSRTAGWDPEEIRNRPLVLSAQRPIQLADLLPTRTVTQDAIKYMEETTFTNNAAEVAEANTYGEAALALTERTQVVEKVGVWLPITDEQLEDVEGLQGYLDNRLPFMLRQRIDSQLLNGTGTTPALQGVLNKSGIQTQAKGGDTTPDAIYKAMTKIRVTGRAIPGAVVIHPNDWQQIRLLTTVDGVYLWGSPSESGPERIWGQAVVQADSITEGTAVVGDWTNFSELAYKRGLDIQVTNAHADFFVNGKQAMRADVRLVVVWTRPAAFCTITGI